MKVIPAGAAVSATADLVPHLTHRVHIYEFPNPWVPTNWGRHGENPPDPAAIDYLVVDTQLLGEWRGPYERLVGRDKQFRVVLAQDGIVLARRALSPGQTSTFMPTRTGAMTLLLLSAGRIGRQLRLPTSYR